MKTKLKKFDLLCENILNEKRANVFTRVFTSQRYIEDDFRLVWQGSGFKKLMLALDNSLGKNSKSKVIELGLPQLDVKNMLDLKSEAYEDLPAGTAGPNASLRLTYDIYPQYKYPLLKTLLSRDENTTDNSSKFGMFIEYFDELVKNAQQGLSRKFLKHINKIKLDMKLQIIASPKSDKGDYTQNKKHTHLSQSSFDCKIFLWFDPTEFKTMLKTQFAEGLKNISSNQNNSTNNKQDNDDLTATSISKQEKDIDSININNSKILLGTQTITITPPAGDGTITKLFNGVKNYNLGNQLYKMTGNALGINKLFRLNGKDTSTEKPDKVRVNKHFWHSLFNIADINKPYVDVKSVVNLENWLYKDDYTKSISDFDKNKTTNMAIQLRKSFDKSKLKIDKNSPGKLTNNIANTKVWQTGQHVGRSIWPENSNPDTIKKYLMPDFGNKNGYNVDQKNLTCRWQYYLDNTHLMYAQYRVAIELTNFYQILLTFYNTLYDFNNYLTQLKSQLITVDDFINKRNDKSFINKLQQNNIFNEFLLDVCDDSSLRSQHGSRNHLHKIDYLKYFINKHEIIVKIIANRQVDYQSWQLDNLFTLWWDNIYKKQIINKHDSPFELVSKKSIYTNNRKSPNNDIQTHSNHGYKAFQDVDNTAARYFKDEILNIPLQFENVSLNDFYYQYIQDQIIKKLDTTDWDKWLKNMDAFISFAATSPDKDIQHLIR